MACRAPAHYKGLAVEARLAASCDKQPELPRRLASTDACVVRGPPPFQPGLAAVTPNRLSGQEPASGFPKPRRAVCHRVLDLLTQVGARSMVLHLLVSVPAEVSYCGE
jgi:hypothetical protein